MTKRIKSVLPIYGMALVFFLYAVIFPMVRFLDLGIALLLSVLAYKFFDWQIPGVDVEVEVTYEATGNKELDERLRQGRGYIERLEELKSLIKDAEVSRRISRLQSISRQIFEQISKNPAQSRKINNFMDYYYPTAMKFLESYAEYDGKGIKSENILATLEKIRASLAQFEEAFEHQLDNLYSDKALDIETDIAVLDDMIKREGL